MKTVRIKALSVNQAWQGRRFKTKAYKQYEHDLMLLLPKIEIPEGEMGLELEIGFSNRLSDWDNPIKPLVDVFQKKYGFDDNRIYEARVKKVLVKKGDEYFSFRLWKI